MSDTILTILISLITFASGCIGSLVGYFTARMAAMKQAEREAQGALFQSRLVAYRDFLEALEHWTAAPDDPSRKALLFRKTTEAMLLASEATADALDHVQAYVFTYSPNKSISEQRAFLVSKSLMLKRMRDDIKDYLSSTKSASRLSSHHNGT